MSIPRTRHFPAWSAALLAGSLALAGCSGPAGNETGSQNPPTTPGSSTASPGGATASMGMSPSTDTAAPSSDGTPGATSTTTPGSPRATATDEGSTPASAPLPANAVDYADALVVAWGTGDQERMARLARPAALQALRDEGTSGGPHWKQVGHDAGAGSVFVRYEDSRDGRTLELRVLNEAASTARDHAVAEARFGG